MKKSFLRLNRDEQADVVRPLMETGGSYGSVAKKVGVKRSRIAGICRDYDIPSKHRPGFRELAKSSSGVVLRLAINEARQCHAKTNGHRCAYEKMSDSDYCALPAHQKLERRR